MPPFRSSRRHDSVFHLLLIIALLLSAFLPISSQVQPTAAFESWWVQNHRETQLWSGPDSGAVSFGQVPQWSLFQVVAPQTGSRLYVQNPVTGNYAYVDAEAVGPVLAMPAAPPTVLGEAPPQALRRPPQPAPDYQPWWVANFLEADLWSGPGQDARSMGRVPQFRRFLVMEPQKADRLRVWIPETDQIGFLDAAVVGPSGPSVWISSTPPRVLEQLQLPGRASGSKSYARNIPVYDDETEVRHLPNNTRIVVREIVQAADGNRWYVLQDGQFLRSTEVRLSRPVDRTLPGRWIDADLTEPATVTAYEGNRIVYNALAIKGTGASTPKGTFQILRRVENETMDSETIGIPRNSPDGYLLKNVLYTQYFTSDGASLHYNYWLGTFGYPGSHGCLGLNLEDAKWFWDWASLGTPVIIR